MRVKAQRVWLPAAAVVGAAVLVSSIASAGVSSAATSRTNVAAVSARSVSSAASVSHPNVKGLHLEFVWDGTPEASQIIEVMAADTMKQWGAKVSFQFAAGTSIAYADMIHGGSFLADSMVDVLNGFNAGVPLTIVGLAQPTQDYVFVARPGINSLSQLAGKTIGILDMQGANGAQLLTVLKAAGLAIGQVTVDDAGGQSERLAALESGRIDATMLSHEALQALGSGYKVLYDYTKQDRGLYDDMWSVKPAFVTQHPQAIEALDEAELLAYVQYNKKASDGMMFNEIRAIDPALTRSSTVSYLDELRNLDAYPDGTVMQAQSLQSQEGAYKSLGAITAAPPLSSFANLKFGQLALNLLGKNAK